MNSPRDLASFASADGHATSDLTFVNARLVLANEVMDGNLKVSQGRIASIEPADSSAAGVIEDLQGDYLLPGLVEIHTDNFERHLMPRPKVHWAELPALLAHDAEIAASGITTVFDALGVGEADTESLRGSAWGSVVSTIANCTRRNLLRADHLLHVRCELPAPNTIDLFAPFGSPDLLDGSHARSETVGEHRSCPCLLHWQKRLERRQIQN
jgi:alpha-D-ribose 1-methylphosphonate 5-triphosphate diphosphatase